MNSIFTVIRFTFMNRFRSKSFIVTTLLFAVILSVLVNLPNIIDRFSSDQPDRIGMVQDSSEIPGRLAKVFSSKENPDIVIVPLSGSGDEAEKAGKAQIQAGEIKGYVQLVPAADGSFPKAVYKSQHSLDYQTNSRLQEGLQKVKQELAVEDAGLTDEQLNKLFSPVSLDAVQISLTGDAGTAGKSQSQMQLAFILVYALLFLLYMGVIGYGNVVAVEITSEKSSRVMELLISSVSPLKQMFGKIIGICLLGLLQILIFVAVGAVNLSLKSNQHMLKELNLNLSDLDYSLLLYFAIFYIFGYLIYATLFAAVGSLVSRTEDVGQAIMPVTLLIVVGFMTAMFGLQNPNAPFVVVMSFIPFFTPLIMFLRLGLSDPAVWEVWLSIAILIGSILVLAWIAAKIYRTGVLLYGKRPSLKELRKAMKAYDV